MSGVNNIGVNTYTQEQANKFMNKLDKNIKAEMEIYSKLSGEYKTVEKDYLKAIQDKDQFKIQELQVKYNQLVSIMKSIQEFVSNRFRMLYEQIGKLSLR